MTVFQTIARDLELCELGIALTKGKRRKAFQQHIAACHQAIRDQNVADGLDKMSADDIANELSN